MKTRRRPAQELRAAIDRLPLEVRQGVLAGIKSRRIIAGEAVDGAGGVCPMVAAHVEWRGIDPQSVARAQEAARAWDRYAQATRTWRPATKHQLVALRAMLEASILEDVAPMAPAPRFARASAARGRRWDTGERDRTAELSQHEGWAWRRPYRSYEEYEREMRSAQGPVRGGLLTGSEAEEVRSRPVWHLVGDAA